MASSFLQRKAEEQAKKIDEQFGSASYGGSGSLKPSGSTTKNTGTSAAPSTNGGGNGAPVTRASDFLTRKATQNAQRVTDLYGDGGYGSKATLETDKEAGAMAWLKDVISLSDRIDTDRAGRQGAYMSADAFDKYRRDTAASIGVLQNRANTYRGYFENNADLYDPDQIAELFSSMDAYGKYLESAKKDLDTEYDFWAQFADEDQYNTWQNWQRWQALPQAEDFAEKSEYNNAYDESRVKRALMGDFYTDFGVDDPYYDYINQNPDVQSHVGVNDAKFHDSHDYWKDLPEEVIRTFNYIYTTEGSDAAYEYIGSAVNKTYTGAQSFIMSFAQPTASLSASLGAGIAKIAGDEEMAQRNKDWYGEFLHDTAAATEQNPGMSKAGSATSALMTVMSIASGVGAINGFSELPALAQSIISGAASMGGSTFIQGIGAASTGYADPKEFALDVGTSTLAGGAGGAASAGLGSVGANFLKAHDLTGNMWARAIVAGVAGAGYSGVRSGMEQGANAIRGKETDEWSIVQDALVGFAFSFVGGLTKNYTTDPGTAAQQDVDDLLVEKYFKDMTPEEAKTAYRQYARQYHPDVSTDPNATAIMAEINSAYARFNAVHGAEAYRAAQEAYAAGDTATYEQANTEFQGAVGELVAAQQSGALSAETAEAVEILQSVASGGAVAAVTGDIPGAAEQIAPLDTAGDLASPQDVAQDIAPVTLPSDVAAPVAGDLEAKVDEAVRTGFDTDAILNMDAINKLTPAEAQAIIDMFDGKNSTPATAPAKAPTSGLPAKAPTPAADAIPTRTAPAIPAAADVKQENINTVAELAAFLGKAGQKVVTEMYSPTQDPAEYYKAMNDVINLGMKHPDEPYDKGIEAFHKVLFPSQVEAAYIAGQADAPKAATATPVTAPANTALQSGAGAGKMEAKKTFIPAKKADWSAHDVYWTVPGKKRPIAYSTVASSEFIEALSEEHPKATISELRDMVNYDEEAKKVLDAYIANGYGDEKAASFFSRDGILNKEDTTNEETDSAAATGTDRQGVQPREAGNDGGRSSELGSGGLRDGSGEQSGGIDAAGRERPGVSGTSGSGAGVSAHDERNDAAIGEVQEGQGEHSEGETQSGVQLTSDEPDAAPAPLQAVTEQEQIEQRSELVSQEQPKGSNFIILEKGGVKMPTTPKARYTANVAAIKTLRNIMAEGRMATPQEQELLAKYTGWGGISEAFDERKSDWAKEFKQLQKLLDADEYKAARGSIMDAYYTDPEIIRAMWNGMNKLGFTGGRLLEPSAGVGRFIGAMPQDMLSGVRSFTAVELDKITGNIAKYLYPNADVRVQRFEEAKIPQAYMDAVIGNVPFGEVGVADKAYPPAVTKLIHNYFIAKSLDKLRPGGVAMLITTSGTMDARTSDARAYFMKQADLIGAVRLPNTAFKGTGTGVVTDILVFKKREAGTPYKGEAFMEIKNKSWDDPGQWGSYPINEYFYNHPEMILGKAAYASGRYGTTLTFNPAESRYSLETQIERALGKIKAKMEYPAQTSQEEIRAEIKADAEKGRPGTIVKKNGKFYVREDGGLVQTDRVKQNDAERVTSILEIRDTARKLLEAQQNGAGAAEIDILRKNLNTLYDTYTKKHGSLNAPGNKRLVNLDGDSPFILALEDYDKDHGVAKKAAIFEKNTIAPVEIITHADTVDQALTITLNETGAVNIGRIAQLTGTTREAALADMLERELVYLDRNGAPVPSVQYLSGNVRAKLRDAEALAEGDERYQRNVEALKKVIPADIAPDDISVRLGATWVPDAVYSSFASEMLGAGTTYVGGRGSVPAVEVTYNRNVGKFFVTVNDPWVKSRPENTTEWGTSDRPFVGSENKSILAAALNNKTVTVWRTVGDQRVMDVQATQAAQEKMAKVLGEFSKWLWKDDTRRTELAALYNDTFNNTVTPKYDGSSLTVIGSNPDMPMRPHQLDAVQRIITSGGNTLLAHRVGAGKTYEMAAAAMKLRQLGIVKKPLIIAPNHVVAQWGKEFLDYFPAAKIKVVEKGSVTAKNRKIFANQVATGDYDAIIMSYEQFEAIPMSVENQEAFYQQQIDNLEMAILESKRARGKDPSVRDMERSKKAFEAKIRGIAEKAKRDVDNIDFEQLGVDALFVDEAHNFKNLFYTTKMQGVADLGNKTGSTRAFDLYMKVRYLQGLNGGRGIVFATATPVMNSVVELYTMQRYLQPDLLEAKGITNFDAWANQFGEVTAIRRMKASGTGYDIKQSLSKYKNMAEMQQMFRAFADVIVDAEDLPYLDIPKMKGGKRIVVECEPGEFQHEFMQELSERAEKLKGSGGTKGGDHIFKIMGDGKMVSYSQHMIDPSLPYEDEGKIMKCVQNVYKLWESSATFTGKDGKTYKNGTQLVFCDRGVPGGTDAERGANIYGDMKNLLVGMGVPAEQIAFIHDADSDEAKAELFKKVNDGDVRILFGSSAKMGTGVNCQRRIVAMHELNAPDRPGDLEQNEGRGIRQKNLNGEVEVYSYVTKRTFDSRQWDTLKRKAIFIHQVMAGDFNGREAAGDGDLATSAAEISAIASDNPLILEQFDISEKISNLENLERAHTKEVNQAKERIKTAQKEIAQDTEYLKRFKNDLARRQETAGDKFKLTLDGKTYTERKAAGEALIAKAKSVLNVGEAETYTEVGSFAGFTMLLTSKGDMLLRGDAQYRGSVNMQSAAGTTQALEAIPKRIDNMIAATETRLSENTAAIAKLEKAAAAPFDHADELTQLRAREMEILAELSPAGETDMGADADEDDGDDREVKRFVQKFREKGSKKAGTKIVAGMSDKQRYEILKDRTLPAPRYDHTKLKKVNADLDGMDHLKEKEAKKLLKTIGEQFDVFKPYQNKDIDVRFTFSRGNLDESVHKQQTRYSNYAKMLTVFDDVVESAVGIEVHRERYNNPASQIENTYVLMSAFRTQYGVVPVLMEVREFRDNTGSVLYLTVSMHEIKETDIQTHTYTAKKGSVSYAPSVSGFRIADIIRNVNVEDGDLLKYLPDGFLDEAQRAAKQEALKKQIAYIAAKNAKRDASGLGSHPERWTAERVGDKNTAPKSVSEIIAGMRHDFGFNVTSGHVRGAGVRGQFSPNDKGIRSRIANDLPTLAHELGHALDDRYDILGARLTKEIHDELKKAAEEIAEGYSAAELEGEGLAEWTRKFLQNRETAAIDYPKLTDHVLKSLSPQDLALLEQLADDVNAYYSLDADTATSSIRFREDGRPDARTGGEKIKAMGHRIYQAWIDSNHGIKLFDDATGSDTYKLASNSAYSDAMVSRIITGNLTDADGQYVAPGLGAALHGINLSDDAEYKAFGEYLVMRHGVEYLAEGKRVFADDRKNSTAFMQRRQAELEQQYPQFEAAAKRLYQFVADLNKTWGVGSGLLSEDKLNEWQQRWPNYVPFNRALPQEGGKAGAKRGFANQPNPYKRAKGSGLDLIHPVDNIIDQIVLLVNAGTRNNVMRAMRDAALKMDADASYMEKIPTPMVPDSFDMTGVKAQLRNGIMDSDMTAGDQAIADDLVSGISDILLQFRRGKAHGNVVTVMVDGQPEFWKINDPLLLESITSLSTAKLHGVLDAYASISRFMTGNITGKNLIWSIFSNFPRDLQTLFTYAPTKNPLKILGGIGSAYVNKIKGDSASPLYKEYLAMGGGEASYYSADRDMTKKARKELAKASKKLNISINPMDWISFVGDTIEMGPRFSTYKFLREKGVDPNAAFYAAMDVTVNFRRGGRLSREVNKVVPFFNASVQGLDKFARWISAEDMPKGERAKTVRSRTFGFIAVSAILAGLFYYINNRDDEAKEDYQQLSNYTKNSFWNIPLGDGKYFAIPKPRELGVLSSFLEALAERTHGGNEHAFDEFYDYFTDQCLPNVLDDVAKLDFFGAIGSLGIIGVGAYMMANRDFLGKPIESAGMQYLEPKDRYNERTSKIAYWVGQAFNVSPQMVDYFFQQTLGGFWKAQKALFPVGENAKDPTLGVFNTYIKDNQYSTDLVNRLYDRATASSQASKSDPNNIDKKITAKMDEKMTEFYGSYNKLAKNDAETTATRGTRQTVLNMIREYEIAAENGTTTRAQDAVYAVVKAGGGTELLPSVMNTYVKDGNKVQHNLSAVQYVEFQLDYNRIYWEYVESALKPGMSQKEKVAVLKQAKDAAADAAKNRTLHRIGAPVTGEYDKYGGASMNDIIQFRAQLDLADDDGSLKQDEVIEILEIMIDKGLSYEDAYALFHARYPKSDKNNPWSWYAP